MISHTCEEPSVCRKFQSTICLHCNLRLCDVHIGEHKKIIDLSNDIQTIFEKINEQSVKRKNTYNNILASAKKWRRVAEEKIEDMYQNYLRSIESEREIIDNIQAKLFQRLECHVQQPFEQLQQQKGVNIESINNIQQTFKQIQLDNVRLKWKPFPTVLLPDAIEHVPFNLPSISVPPEPNNNESVTKKTSSSTKNFQPNNGASLKRLVAMFGNISSIEQSKNDITQYLQKLGKQCPLPIVICSYLTAWYKQTIIDKRAFLLNEHLTTVQKYLINSKSDFDIMIGLQAFFHNQKMTDNKGQMMTFFIEFFLNHQCLNTKQLFNWYKNSDINGSLAYKGFHHARDLATPFVRSLIKQKTDINPSVKIEIKQE